MKLEPHALIASLPCWRSTPRIEPLQGGMTNRNYLVHEGPERFVVRLGEDIPVHYIARSSELAISRAAASAGLSPAVIHAQPGVLVLRHIEGRTLQPADMRDPKRLPAVIDMVQRCHRDVVRHLGVAAPVFDVFAIFRGYASTLRTGGSHHAPILAGLLERASVLERLAGARTEVFAHNDLLPANFIEDGARLWLIDWEYAGLNTPLFDLGGLAAHGEFSHELEQQMLALYFSRADAETIGRYRAMKCAALLREAMWGMIAELTSTLEIDFAAYTGENLARFERAWGELANGAAGTQRGAVDP